MFKKIKMLVVAVFMGVLLLGVNNVAYAVSCKNPTIKVYQKYGWCRKCDKRNGAIEIYLHYGHEIESLKINGKEIDVLYEDAAGKCKTCKKNVWVDIVNLKKGTYKVEVRDDKGYWVIQYVTIDTKGCNHMHLNY